MNIAAIKRQQEPEERVHTEPAARSVLIVEDDLSVVEYLEHVLDHLRPGLDLDYATSAEDAMSKIRSRGGVEKETPYSLVIADIFLDGEMTGFDFWLECAKSFPDMPVVITSSLSAERYLTILSGFENTPTFLPKPLTPGRCRSVIEEFI